MHWLKRVSTLREGVLRLECIPQGIDQPEPTFAVRHPERFTQVTTRRQGNKETVLTKFFSLTLTQDGKPWSPSNLLVEWAKGAKQYRWRPGTRDHENLGGAFFALDLCNQHLIAHGIHPYDPMKGIDCYQCSPADVVNVLLRELKQKLGRNCTGKEWVTEFRNLLKGRPPTILDHWTNAVKKTLRKARKYPPGYLSRSGVSIILDDSLPWDRNRAWLKERPEFSPQCLYLIYYGDDFKKGVSLLTEILGPLPAVPEWMMGIWFSCYRKMGEKEFHKLKEDFQRHDLPLDVIVVDTDWHKHFWHGFDWNEKLFPDPARFARWLRKHNLHATFNVHPQYIPKDDSQLGGFLKRTGADEVYLDGDTAPHPFHAGCVAVDLCNKKQTKVYFDIFHRPIERCGCDFWWIDGTVKDDRGRDSTTWLNQVYYRFTGKKESRRLPVFSRTGGLGSHRVAIAFTGDAFSQWEVLEQEVIMTPRAANVLLAYVSHDIGGFIEGLLMKSKNKPPDDLYLRWLQFGCLSPIMRLHSDHGVREPWRFKKQTLQIARNFLSFRKCLAPYLMKLVRNAHRQGVALCRPMYYEFPHEEEAYTFEKQYLLGEALLVSPVTNQEGKVTTWFPPGTWYHCFIERSVKGPKVVTERIPLDLIPVYAREGCTIPYRKNTSEAGTSTATRVLTYHPGAEPLVERMSSKVR